MPTRTMKHLDDLVHHWFPVENDVEIEELSFGLINSTWKLKITENGPPQYFILQKVNTNVFKDISAIDNNWRRLLREITLCYNNDFSPCVIPDLVPTYDEDGRTYIETEDGTFRVMKYIPNTTCSTVVENPSIAFEVAKQFGKFCATFANVSPSELQDTIPDFHNLSLRYCQFQEAMSKGVLDRISSQQELISETLEFDDIVKHYQDIIARGTLQKRVAHHDTKVSNVLLDEMDGKGVAVIDLDTCMAGYFISDLGDMFRTMLCPLDENSNNFEDIVIRMDVFDSILRGYLSEVIGKIPQTELQQALFAGEFMIYMQALRFAADYLNGDVYYKIDYESHNLVRWKNQLTLLKKYRQNRNSMQRILNDILHESK